MGNVAHYIHSAGECLFFRNLLNILGYTYIPIYDQPRGLVVGVSDY